MDEHASYPAMRFLLRHGKWIAWLVGIVMIAAGVRAAWGDASGLYAGALIAGGLLATLVLLVLRELVHIVADTLLPPE